MEAIHETKKTVVATDTKHDTTGWDLSDYYDIAGRSFYDTLTTLNLFPGIFYYSLDSHSHAATVRDYREKHLLHCSIEASPVASIGDIFALQNMAEVSILYTLT